VGMVTATAADCTATSTSSSTGLRTPSTAWPSSARVLSQVSSELVSSSRRRSSASASAPPHSAKTSSGTSPATPMYPTQRLDRVSRYICTGTATAVSWLPKNDVVLPMKMRRYAGWRSGRTSRARRRSELVTGSSWAEALDDPALPGQPVPQPVVQPAGLALPELHTGRREAVPAPVRRCRYLTGEPPLGRRPRLLQGGPVGDALGLGAGPGAELGTARPDREIVLGLRARGALDRAGDDHLPVQRVPREDQAGVRVGVQLPALARLVVGEEHE